MFSESIKKNGCIEVICGSMFSGKTEELIRRLRRAQFANQKIAVFKPLVDVRYAEDEVVSHDMKSLKAKRIKSAAEILEIEAGIEVVGIDEAQFFDDTLISVVEFLANRGTRVIVAGLDTDYLGNPFGPMPQIMALAEDVQKVHAICVKCGALANNSHRLADNSELVLLGEKNTYEPLCRTCFNKLRKS